MHTPSRASRVGVVITMLATAQLACGTPPVRYRLPIQGNDAGVACYRACHPLLEQGRERPFIECIETCPGIERTVHAECDHARAEDQPPVAACVTTAGRSSGPPAALVVGIVVVVLGGLALFSYWAAASGGM